MRIKAFKNNTNTLPEKLQGFAFNQDESGDIDITIGKLYDVYGTLDNESGRFYLVLTDDINNDIPWWMPAQLYQITDETIPTNWIKKEASEEGGEKSTIQKYHIYFDAEEDIEDGTERGYQVFAEMKAYEDI